MVDIGGGTTDCSLIEMGPSWRGKADRTASLLAHSGQRIGGNDLDIALAFKQLMFPFGMESKMESGIMMPTTQFWNPIAINNVEAQSDFYSRENLSALKLLHKQAQEPEAGSFVRGLPRVTGLQHRAPCRRSQSRVV